MAKKWNDFTRREKTIGVLVAVFAVFAIGGISNAMSGGSSPVPTQAPVTTPVTTTKEVVETEAVPYAKETKDDNTLASGTTKIITAGVDGVKTKTYKVTLENGVEAKKELTSEVLTTAPVNEVTAVGTYVAPVKKTSSNCDSNYSGACVPIASDVDCAGGSGNGPAYVSGPVYVVGSDIYQLDRDGDGVGCE